MAKTLIGALALGLLPSALAFGDASPFFLFSTSDIQPNDLPVLQSKDVTNIVQEALSSCPSKTYLMIQQNGVTAMDYTHRPSVPRLSSYVVGGVEEIKSRFHVPTLVGKFDTDALSSQLQKACGAKLVDLKGPFPDAPIVDDGTPRVVLVNLPRLSSNRRASMKENDFLLEGLIYELAPAGEYTVIYTTSYPTEQEEDPVSSAHAVAYEMEDPYESTVQMELKRDTTFSPRAERTHEGGLFEKYQYFTPGIFMGLVAMVPLILILGVALNAIAGLEVSYFAFSKEMGPTAQKKQQ
ncbi:BIG1-domain-containing protein [Sporormia fimetaria CBS 119925]|uniref:Protein BIG1 n=1 Tax=Sporormia fimetaria CBS 119925 TaxID=1340428 RepID=A0A6A6VH99_9PLEO|nr:BIG1-domain-containing protein [Sporormia fimetaria CBS 119925]